MNMKLRLAALVSAAVLTLPLTADVAKAVPRRTVVTREHHYHGGSRRYRDAGLFAPVVAATDVAGDIAHGVGDVFVPHRHEEVIYETQPEIIYDAEPVRVTVER